MMMAGTYQCKLHVAFLAPPWAPRVANDPIAARDINANNVDGMVDVVRTCAARKDAALVGSPVSGVDNNAKRPSGEDVIDHCLLPINRVIIHHGDGVIPFCGVARCA